MYNLKFNQPIFGSLVIQPFYTNVTIGIKSFLPRIVSEKSIVFDITKNKIHIDQTRPTISTIIFNI